MHEQVMTVRLTGTGTTKERCFGDALRQVQREVGRKVRGTSFRIEPTALRIVSAVEHQRTERFLGLLFPRKRSKFVLTIDVEVRVASVDLGAVKFGVRTEKLGRGQHLLQLR
ncbi:DUF4312 family protein [Amycolatopsis taiwanensis]|uniref:Cytoplasmic protein n=1 Tax=Amycolatopsis taiwanensis TaxID=342230 RepID=A0A9W6VGL9_9PSEU|nr:DUF4312 family protein [Amycolatopsis taiwanensis]GLY66114.1 hypothetical protein Atai01_27330 [Amycolatopsis taiwanensis]